MGKKCPGSFDVRLEPIFEHKSGTDRVFFRNFEKSFDLPGGLNITHMKTLLSLDFLGGCSMSELSRKMQLEKGSFTTVAASLVDKGFINKERSIDDKRIYHLVLTESGRELSTKFRRAHSEYIRAVLNCLDQDERIEYHHHLTALNRLNGKLEEKWGLG